MFYKDDRLALYIDGPNLYATSKALGFDVDYKLLRQEFMRRSKWLRALYYTTLPGNNADSTIRPFSAGYSITALRSLQKRPKNTPTTWVNVK